MQTSGVDGYVYCLHCSDNNTGVHLCPTHQTVYITYMWANYIYLNTADEKKKGDICVHI